MASQKLSEKEILEWISPIQDPEIHLGIVDLGLVYKCEMKENDKVHIEMTLTSPACPAGDFIMEQIKSRLLEHPSITDAQIEVVWDPKWDPKEMASDEIKDKLGLW